LRVDTGHVDYRRSGGYAVAAAKITRAARDTSNCEVSMAMAARLRSWLSWASTV
jgi:hypothetical protein